MKRTLVRLRNSGFHRFIRKHEKYAPIFFFVAGFIFDSLTLGRIDRLYDLTVLCLHMTSLTLTLFLYNLADDGWWKNTLLGKYEDYLPLAIQFFFGGLSSAFVIYFSRSVSLSKTLSFFVILVVLLFANELLKKRISNKYLQFGVYFFISFTFFAFMIPVFMREMNTEIFLISGGVSLGITLVVILAIYKISPSTRAEVHLGKLLGIIVGIYTLIHVFYFFKMIPPVPLAMQSGVVAHKIEMKNNRYYVTHEREDWEVFWRDHRYHYIHKPGDEVYVFSAIFAPTDLKMGVFHRWNWYNPSTKEWEVVEDIGYEITGGRDGGFRGYTYKNNVQPGEWKVEVITEEELVLGVISFEIVVDATQQPKRLITRRF